MQLDSIADVVTFGIAPAVLAYAWGYGSAFAQGSNAHKLGWFLSFMFLICGAFRLARYNVQATRPRVLAEGLNKVDKKNFVGLPIPMAGGFIAALVHFSPAPLSLHGVEMSTIYSGLLMGAIALLSVLMVSTVRYTVLNGRCSSSARSAVLAMPPQASWLAYSRYVLVSRSAVRYLGSDRLAGRSGIAAVPIHKYAPATQVTL